MCIFKKFKKSKYAEANQRNRLSEGIRPTEEQILASPRYKRVLILGVDGAGDYFNKCDTPNFHRMFETGSVTYTAQSQFPTISAQNWASVLHGVRYQTHKITNEIASAKSFTDTQYPSVFKAYAERHPDAKFASIVNWFPINRGIVEKDISGMTKIDCKKLKMIKTDREVDENVLQETLTYLDKEDPSIFFLHFDNPDSMGHAFGYGTEEYKKSVEIVDGLLGQIYDFCERKGMLEDTLFIVVSDHGHILPKSGKKGGGHGGWTESERNITIAVGGKKGIIQGTMGKASTPDVASICFYALGEKQPDSWESAVPTHIFTSLE